MNRSILVSVNLCVYFLNDAFALYYLNVYIISRNVTLLTLLAVSKESLKKVLDFHVPQNQFVRVSLT